MIPLEHRHIKYRMNTEYIRMQRQSIHHQPYTFKDLKGTNVLRRILPFLPHLMTLIMGDTLRRTLSPFETSYPLPYDSPNSFVYSGLLKAQIEYSIPYLEHPSLYKPPKVSHLGSQTNQCVMYISSQITPLGSQTTYV